MITTHEVLVELGLPEVTGPDAEHLEQVVKAVNAYVYSLGYTDPWTDSAQLGAVILGARWWNRRNSPTGTAGYDAAGGGVIARSDPDVARLLKIDRFADGVVA